ncbi:lytic transglycosylase domain-containing protein [Pantoea vagans]|uniref:lytic transglycosylase domain-containing protein n=1 Tax=Pantoea vagans TaxID=470934 RepID=UPI0028B21B27|nr:lytic transglycosylase domain-containing protein [Pantoea vagans]
MATIIDALVVTLGLDATGFNKGQKEVKGGLDDTKKKADQAAKDMEAAGKRAASFFGSIRTELLALVGVTLSVQGLKNFITGMTDNLQQLAVNSRSLDMSAKSLDGWQRAAEAAGSSAEKITGTLSGFQSVLTQIRTGGGQDNPLFAALSSFAGATGANFDYQNDNSEEVMRKIADNWGKLSKDAQRRFGGMFNFDNQTQQALTNGNLVTDADRFTKMSRATEDATRKAQEFNRRLAEMKQNFSAASQVLYEALIPYVEKLIPLIEKVGIWITEHGPEIQKFFSDTSNEISQVVDAVGGWQNALEILAAFVAGSWALKMLSGISKVRGGFGPLLAAIAAVSAWDKLKSNEDEAKKAGKTTGQYLVDKMNNNTGSTSGLMGKADAWLKKSYAWWDSISSTGGASNEYDAYGTASKAKGSGKAMLEWMTPLFSKLETLYKLPSGLLKSVATTESGGNQFAISGAGAKGLFQIMDGTARDLGLKGGDVFDPEKSANAAAKYLSQLLKSNGGDLVKAIASYNWGAGNVQRKGLENAPLETRNYVPKVLAGIQVGSQATASRQLMPQQQQAAKTEIHIGEMNMQSNATSVNALGQDVQRNVSRNSLLVPSMSGQG